jgi:hypothetical protein
VTVCAGGREAQFNRRRSARRHPVPSKPSRDRRLHRWPRHKPRLNGVAEAIRRKLYEIDLTVGTVLSPWTVAACAARSSEPPVAPRLTQAGEGEGAYTGAAGCRRGALVSPEDA